MIKIHIRLKGQLYFICDNTSENMKLIIKNTLSLESVIVPN